MNNKKGTKRALLSSVLALVLCFSMLVGTTFAWFTDTATAGVNTIQSGTLDIVLEYSEDGGNTWLDAEGQTLNFKTADDRSTDIYWEPGCTYELPLIRVRNNGNLALKYEIVISGLTGDVKLLEAIDFYVNGEKLVDSYNGTLLENEKVSDTMLIKGHMREDAGNEYQSLTVEGISITVYATQMAYENDSYGPDYDKNASVTIAPGESLADAIKNVEDGGIVFLESGDYNLSSGPIVIENKTVTIIGMGHVTINKNYGNTHIFTVKNGADVTIKNVTMDGKGNTREGIYVRWNSKVTLEDVVIRNTGGSDIMIDEASDAAHGENTASYVYLIDTDIEDVAMCASPVTTVAATQDTYVYFNYDKDSTVGVIDVQGINKKPENIIINGVKSTEIGTTMQLYVSNDAELTSALETIKTDSNYWNKNVVVYMAAGEYSADHIINQYPQWNGVVGAGATANNYAAGVPAGADTTVVTFVGANTNVRSASADKTVFTGNVTVNGFGNAGTGFGSAVASTTFQNIVFDAANSVEANGKDYIVMYVQAAASNVNFEGCTFENATHITLGGSGANGVGKVSFDECTFNEGGCLSGYAENLSVSNSLVTSAKKGFISNQKAGTVTVENCDITCSEYAFRTQNSGIEITVTDSKINVAEEVDGVRALVVFRGSGHSADFTDCDLAYGTATAGNGTGEISILNYSTTEDGLVLVTDGLSSDVELYVVPTEYTDATVNVPEGVTTIGGYAFAYNSNIETIILPSTVTTLSDRAFRDTSASNVVLNEGLTNISYQAFRNALNVTSVEIPSTVTTISKEAFQNSGITSLTIPASVATLEYGACRDMKVLESVVIEGNVDIPIYAFRACTNLKNVEIKGTDVTFGGGSRGMIFTTAENGDGSAITITVANEVIKARLLAADTAAKDYGGYTIICKQSAQEGGYYADDQGNATAYDAKSLDAALKSDNVTTVILPDDLTFNADETTANSGYGATGVKVAGGVLDGNGNTLTVKNAWNTWDCAVNTTGGTIKNLTINSGMRGIFMGGATADVYIDNVIIDGTIYTFNSDGGSKDFGVYISNSTLNGWTSFSNVHKEVIFTNCNFGEGNGYAFCRPYNATTFTNCVFEEGFVINPVAAIVLEGCYYGDTLITAENIASFNLISGDSALVTVQ